MSRIVKGTGWRPLSHVVKTEDGKLYLVDSNNTFDYGYETMVFEWEDDEVSSWLGEYRENYSSETAMRERHFEICEMLEDVLKGAK